MTTHILLGHDVQKRPVPGTARQPSTEDVLSAAHKNGFVMAPKYLDCVASWGTDLDQ